MNKESRLNDSNREKRDSERRPKFIESTTSNGVPIFTNQTNRKSIPQKTNLSNLKLFSGIERGNPNVLRATRWFTQLPLKAH